MAGVDEGRHWEAATQLRRQQRVATVTSCWRAVVGELGWRAATAKWYFPFNFCTHAQKRAHAGHMYMGTVEHR